MTSLGYYLAYHGNRPLLLAVSYLEIRTKKKEILKIKILLSCFPNTAFASKYPSKAENNRAALRL